MHIFGHFTRNTMRPLVLLVLLLASTQVSCVSDTSYPTRKGDAADACVHFRSRAGKSVSDAEDYHIRTDSNGDRIVGRTGELCRITLEGDNWVLVSFRW